MSAPRLPGTWKLGAGRAITLQPSEGGILRVAHGRIWATLDGPHGAAPDDSGDHVMGVGEQLRLAAGQRVVFEAWSGASPAYFSWDPAAQPVAVRAARMERVVQPLADLRLALAFGAGAAGRLAAGLGALVLELVGLRALKAQASACRAHGAMS